jgi:hypothetical protein
MAAVLAWVPLAHAQDQLPQPPAHVALVDGRVTLDREGITETLTGGMPFLPGDRIQTTNGRAEVMFPDGSVLDIDEFSSIELQSPTLLRLTAGRVILIVAGAGDPAAAPRFQIDTPVATAATDGPGEYRVAILTAPSGLEAELAVTRGFAALTTEQGTMPVRAGERSLARDFAAPGYPQAFNSARFDAFDRWSALQRDARLGSTSSQYLPRDLQMYSGAFDRYGGWQYEAPYGHVWYPVVTPGWRPYYNGYWASLRLYGWTWIGVDFWSWPTHHYGRWGHARNRWFWIPDRRWGPAWVTWASAPGYVSWCPLGFDNRPVFGLSVNVGNPWRGWVVVPRTHFHSRAVHVRHHAVPDHRIPGGAPFVTHAAAPIAAPRGGGDRAVPRGAAVAAAPQTAGAPGPGYARSRNGVTTPPGSATRTAAPGAVDRSSISRQPLAAPRRSDPGTDRGVDRAYGSRSWPNGAATRQAVPRQAPQSAPGAQPDQGALTQPPPYGGSGRPLYSGPPRGELTTPRRREMSVPRSSAPAPSGTPMAMPRVAPRSAAPPQPVAPEAVPAPRYAAPVRPSAPASGQYGAPAQRSAPPAQRSAPPAQQRSAPPQRSAPAERSAAPAAQPRAVPRGAPAESSRASQGRAQGGAQARSPR